MHLVGILFPHITNNLRNRVWVLNVPGWGPSPMVSSCEDNNKFPGSTWGDIYLIVVWTLSLKKFASKKVVIHSHRHNKISSVADGLPTVGTIHYLVLLYFCKLMWTFWKEKSQNLLQMNHSTSSWIKTSIYTNTFQ